MAIGAPTMKLVMPAKAGIQFVDLLGSRLRGKDEWEVLQCFRKSFHVSR